VTENVIGPSPTELIDIGPIGIGLTDIGIIDIAMITVIIAEMITVGKITVTAPVIITTGMAGTTDIAVIIRLIAAGSESVSISAHPVTANIVGPIRPIVSINRAMVHMDITPIRHIVVV